MDAFPEGMLRGQRAELRDVGRGRAARHGDLEPQLHRRQPQLVDAPRLGQDEPVPGQVVEQPAAPQAERLLAGARRVLQPSGGERRAAGREQLLEPGQVEHVGRRHQRVAGPARLDRGLARRRGEHLPQVGHVDLDDVGGGLRRRLAPQLVHQAVDAQRLAGVQREQREQRALPGRSERQRHAVALDRERPQQPEGEHPTTVAIPRRR